MSIATRFHTSWAASIVALLLLAPLAFTLAGCDSQLEERTFDVVAEDDFYNNESEFLNAASGAYAALRLLNWDALHLHEHTADAIMVPTRGTDWGDGGAWRVLTQHEWTPTQGNIDGAWSDNFIGVARTNAILTALVNSEGNLDPELAQQFSAEMRFLRAFFYFELLDLFGNVPIVVEEGGPLGDQFDTQPLPPGEPPAQSTRRQVFDFIMQELVGCTSENMDTSCITSPAEGSVLAGLPDPADVPYGRANTGAGYALAARMLINAEIFTSESTPNGPSGGVGFYEEAEAAADQVIDSGDYSLAPNYFENFAVDNFRSPEIIFPMALIARSDVGGLGENLGMDYQQRFLHYNHPIPSSAFNGFTTIAPFYEGFDVEPGPDGELGTKDDVSPDARVQTFMRGAQFDAPAANCFGNGCFSDENSPRTFNRGGTPLDYLLEIPNIILSGDQAALEEPGLRPMKWELDPGQAGLNMGNDVPVIRLAEMYLIKAEAQNEQGDIAGATASLNFVRERSGVDINEDGMPDLEPIAVPSSTLEMHQFILQERGYEFVYEGIRRQDLIRYQYAYGGNPVGFEGSDDPGASVYAPTYTGPWLFKEPSEGFRTLFPIPATQLGANPELTQNPGY